MGNLNEVLDEEAAYSRIDPKSYEIAKREAIAKGFDVVIGHPKILLLDIDTQDAMRVYESMLPMTYAHFGAQEVERWRSKSGQGWHIVLEINEALTPPEKVALQACLGSDLKRELLSIVSHKNGVAEPSILFKPIRTLRPETE